MTTCSDDERGIEISTHSSIPGRVRLVQIDTVEGGGRLRVNLNDAPIWDGDPEVDEVPGGHFEIDWPVVHVSEEVARDVWQFFEGHGAGPGNFATLLIRTILAADNQHAELLGLGHREWVRAVGLWRSDKDELARLAGIGASAYSETRGGTDG